MSSLVAVRRRLLRRWLLDISSSGHPLLMGKSKSKKPSPIKKSGSQSRSSKSHSRNLKLTGKGSPSLDSSLDLCPISPAHMHDGTVASISPILIPRFVSPSGTIVVPVIATIVADPKPTTNQAWLKKFQNQL